MMEYYPERKRLGISFLASILIHLSFFLLLAILSTETIKPALPEAKKIMVELFERPVDETDSAPEEMERIAEKSKTVEKQFAPKAIPKQITPPLPSTKIQEATVLEALSDEKPTEKPEVKPVSKAELTSETKLEEEVEEKSPLPVLSELIPSYDNIVRQMPEAQPERDIEEGDEISLNTTEFKYLSYFSKLKDRIQMVWRYPEAAKVTGLQGRLVLKFVLNRDGSLRELRVVKSSGIDILDDAAIKAIRRAAPFYAIPKNLGDVLSIVANFEYELDYYYVK